MSDELILLARRLDTIKARIEDVQSVLLYHKSDGKYEGLWHTMSDWQAELERISKELSAKKLPEEIRLIQEDIKCPNCHEKLIRSLYSTKLICLSCGYWSDIDAENNSESAVDESPS